MFLKWKGLLGFLIAVSAAPIVVANEVPLKLSEGYAQQKAAILRDFSGGEVYSEIEKADQETVMNLLNRMETRLGNAASLSDIPEHERASIVTEQEQINQILTKARGDSRMICRRERTVGTHRQVNQCLTVAQRREIRERAQHELSNGQRSSTQLIGE